MRALLRSVMPALVAGCLCLVSFGDGHAQGGEWSNHAAAVPSKRSFVIPSPDRKRIIVVDGGQLSVGESGVVVAGGEGIDILQSAEVLWAPDSKAFAVTSSDGSEHGGWDVSIFVLERDRCNYYGVTTDAVQRFRARHACGDEELNIGAVAWTKESKQLLIALEAPRGSACRDRGASGGFIVNVPSGTIAVEYDGARLREDWRESLGRRFDQKAR
jgi:hypothetical protein